MVRIASLFSLCAVLVALVGWTQAEAQPEAQPGKGKDTGPPAISAEELFNMLDTNKDKKLNKQEFLKLTEIVSKQLRDAGREVPEPQIRARLELEFTRVDLDGDAHLTLEELNKGREQRGKAKDGGKETPKGKDG